MEQQTLNLSRKELQTLISNDLQFKERIKPEEEDKSETVIFRTTTESVTNELLEKLNEVYPFKNFSIAPKRAHINVVLELAESYEESFFAEDPTSVCKWCGDTVKKKHKESHQKSCVHNPENKGNKSVQLKNKRKKAIRNEYDRLKDNNNLPDTEVELVTKILSNLKNEGVLPENYREDEATKILEQELKEFRGLKQNEKCDCPVTKKGSIRHEEDCEFVQKALDSEVDIDLDKSQKPDDEVEEEEQEETGEDGSSEEEGNFSLQEFKDMDRSLKEEKVMNIVDEEGEIKGRDIIEEVWGREVDTQSKRYNRAYNIVSDLDRQGYLEKDKDYRGNYSVTEEGRKTFFRDKVEEESSSSSAGEGTVEYDDENIAEPYKIRNISKDEWDNLRDATSSEVVLRHLADTPKTPEELGEVIFEDSENVNGCFKIKRLLEDYIDGVVGKGSSSVEEDKYYLDKNARKQIKNYKPSLSQVMRAGKSPSVGSTKCLECGEIFRRSKEAKKHRRKMGHFNWAKASELPSDWQQNGDNGEWKKALVS